jgi:hypothetical protein
MQSWRPTGIGWRDLLGGWVLMTCEPPQSKNAGRSKRKNSDSRSGLCKTPVHVVAKPTRVDEMPWIAFANQLRVSPTGRMQTLRRIKEGTNRPRCSDDQRNRRSDQQKSNDSARHKRPNENARRCAAEGSELQPRRNRRIHCSKSSVASRSIPRRRVRSSYCL